MDLLFCLDHLLNFVTVHELVKKLDPQIVRFLMATTQYRHAIRYSQANLDDAKTNLNKRYSKVARLTSSLAA